MSVRAYARFFSERLKTIPGTKPPPSIRAFFQVYVSAASETFAVLSAASAGGVPASSPAASASTAVRMRVLRTGGPFRERGEWGVSAFPGGRELPGDPQCGRGPPGRFGPAVRWRSLIREAFE